MRLKEKVLKRGLRQWDRSEEEILRMERQGSERETEKLTKMKYVWEIPNGNLLLCKGTQQKEQVAHDIDLP